ncbi:MAG: hypothetical protein A2161_09120 [Candidatus Schekmanbacteria bacterium RBG_13_48_7]|uniref:Uncharacterized protein n=1 Tax=Candidatus Schekmanbacteria bacterium RBG_13_48_7 TaxID=1817878 RepID=A0A1F7S0S8_9BACT|nr:MAG: hypothetical protein A2161_09120 [Candidatus Schekmanbacteria bacterium RBG_13_48_7]
MTKTKLKSYCNEMCFERLKEINKELENEGLERFIKNGKCPHNYCFEIFGYDMKNERANFINVYYDLCDYYEDNDMKQIDIYILRSFALRYTNVLRLLGV